MGSSRFAEAAAPRRMHHARGKKVWRGDVCAAGAAPRCTDAPPGLMREDCLSAQLPTQGGCPARRGAAPKSHIACASPVHERGPQR